jgi:uncharacterized protein
MTIPHIGRARAVLLLTILFTAAASFQDASGQRTVSVIGEGVVRVMPDQAVVRFGVVATSENPEEARELNARAASAAMDQVRSLGIEERHIRLERLQIQPERRYNQQTRNYDQIGFEAIREVSVTLTDLDQLPVLVARIVQNGANRLNGITYEISDREAVRRSALVEAAGNARVKADLLAVALGATLGAVSQISEQGAQIPRPMVRMDEITVSALRSADAAPEPAAYASGEIEVRATVTVVYFLN